MLEVATDSEPSDDSAVESYPDSALNADLDNTSNESYGPDSWGLNQFGEDDSYDTSENGIGAIDEVKFGCRWRQRAECEPI